MTTNDVSPYLQRPVRTLEEVMAEAEQRLEQASSPPAAPSKTGEASAPIPRHPESPQRVLARGISALKTADLR